MKIENKVGKRVKEGEDIESRKKELNKVKMAMENISNQLKHSIDQKWSTKNIL